MEYAGVAFRFFAVLIDGIILLVLINAVGALAGAAAAGWWPLLIVFAYYTGCETLAGKTIGKHAVGLRVVDASGNPIGLVQAINRNLLRFVDFFLLYLVAAIAVWSTPKRQRIGDLVAATVVVHDRGERRERLRPRRPAYEPPEYPHVEDSMVYSQERFLEDLARAKRAGD